MRIMLAIVKFSLCDGSGLCGLGGFVLPTLSILCSFLLLWLSLFSCLITTLLTRDSEVVLVWFMWILEEQEEEEEEEVGGVPVKTSSLGKWKLAHKRLATLLRCLCARSMLVNREGYFENCVRGKKKMRGK